MKASLFYSLTDNIIVHIIRLYIIEMCKSQNSETLCIGKNPILQSLTK